MHSVLYISTYALLPTIILEYHQPNGNLSHFIVRYFPLKHFPICYNYSLDEYRVPKCYDIGIQICAPRHSNEKIFLHQFEFNFDKHGDGFPGIPIVA